jgi:nucleoside-diphosphate-sugar epimerase
MKRILVTGAGGYIGTRLVPALLARGWAVRAVDRFFFGEELLPDHENLQKVREDTRRLTGRHFEGVDAVIDLVAISNEACGELFQDATWQINCESRIRTAGLARDAGVGLYILPSSCSVYGAQDRDAICDESATPKPLTAYGQANLQAEQGTLALADDSFAVVVLRQATVFGPSPRIRLDLAINYMVHRAWQAGLVPVVRDGTQWRPFLHIDDAVDAQLFMLEKADRAAVSGQVFNVGAEELNYTGEALGKLVVESLPRPAELEWVGDPDERSYHIDCGKIESLGWQATRRIPETVRELWRMFESGQIEAAPQTHTLQWYRELEHWRQIIRRVEMYGGILDIDAEGK